MGCGFSSAALSPGGLQKYFTPGPSIGRGGFATIRVATYGPENLVFASKEINIRKVIERSNGLTSLRNEVVALKLVSPHHFITNLHFSYTDRVTCFLILDLCTGGDLRFHIGNACNFQEKGVAFIVACIGSALHHVHSCGVIHRDVKPENILFTSHGLPKLTDFGVAHYCKHKRDIVCSISSGTMRYLAPEVLTPSHRHSFEADFWALGTVMIELLALQRAFKKHCPREMVQYSKDEYCFMWDSLQRRALIAGDDDDGEEEEDYEWEQYDSDGYDSRDEDGLHTTTPGNESGYDAGITAAGHDDDAGAGGLANGCSDNTEMSSRSSRRYRHLHTGQRSGQKRNCRHKRRKRDMPFLTAAELVQDFQLSSSSAPTAPDGRDKCTPLRGLGIQSGHTVPATTDNNMQSPAYVHGCQSSANVVCNVTTAGNLSQALVLYFVPAPVQTAYGTTLTDSCRDMIHSLLDVRITHRLGVGHVNYEKFATHSFFRENDIPYSEIEGFRVTCTPAKYCNPTISSSRRQSFTGKTSSTLSRAVTSDPHVVGPITSTRTTSGMTPSQRQMSPSPSQQTVNSQCSLCSYPPIGDGVSCFSSSGFSNDVMNGKRGLVSPMRTTSKKCIVSEDALRLALALTPFKKLPAGGQVFDEVKRRIEYSQLSSDPFAYPHNTLQSHSYSFQSHSHSQSGPAGLPCYGKKNSSSYWKWKFSLPNLCIAHTQSVPPTIGVPPMSSSAGLHQHRLPSLDQGVLATPISAPGSATPASSSCVKPLPNSPVGEASDSYRNGARIVVGRGCGFADGGYEHDHAELLEVLDTYEFISHKHAANLSRRQVIGRKLKIGISPRSNQQAQQHELSPQTQGAPLSRKKSQVVALHDNADDSGAQVPHHHQQFQGVNSGRNDVLQRDNHPLTPNSTRKPGRTPTIVDECNSAE